MTKSVLQKSAGALGGGAIYGLKSCWRDFVWILDGLSGRWNRISFIARYVSKRGGISENEAGFFLSQRLRGCFCLIAICLPFLGMTGVWAGASEPGQTTLELVKSHLRSGRYRDAFELLGTFDRENSSKVLHDLYVDAHLLRGLENFRNEQYDAVLSDFRSAAKHCELEKETVSKPRRSAQVFCMIAHVLEETGKSEEATRFYEKAVNAKQSSAVSELTYYRAVAMRALGREDEADRLFEEIIRFGQTHLEGFSVGTAREVSDPSSAAQSFYIRGLGRLGLGDYEKARGDFLKALSLNPGHYWARAGLAGLD